MKNKTFVQELKKSVLLQIIKLKYLNYPIIYLDLKKQSNTNIQWFLHAAVVDALYTLQYDRLLVDLARLHLVAMAILQLDADWFPAHLAQLELLDGVGDLDGGQWTRGGPAGK